MFQKIMNGKFKVIFRDEYANGYQLYECFVVGKNDVLSDAKTDG